MDWSFTGTTFLRLLAALPLTLEVWALSVILGAIVAAGVTWMRVSGSKPLEIARARLCRRVSRHAAPDPAVHRLLRPCVAAGGPRTASSGRSCATPSTAACCRSALCTAGYQAEIFRGALLAVPHGQVEAARACGMSSLTLVPAHHLPDRAAPRAAGLFDRDDLDGEGDRARLAHHALGRPERGAEDPQRHARHLPAADPRRARSTSSSTTSSAPRSLASSGASRRTCARGRVEGKRPCPPRRPPSPSRTCASASARSRC